MEYDDDSPLGEHVGEFGLCGCSSDELRNAFLYVLKQLEDEDNDLEAIRIKAIAQAREAIAQAREALKDCEELKS